VFLFLLGFAIMCCPPVIITGWLAVKYVQFCGKYLEPIVRVFQEKPLFVIPRGQPLPEAEDLSFPTSDGLTLRGCYLATSKPRRGVILFGLEFGSNRWSCRSYCDHLLEAGFDVFAFESRNQGDSNCMPNYDPLQWVTDYEVRDAQAALAYLKARPDANPRGIGFFGISKGAGAGVLAAAVDPYVRCIVTDGMFATYTTVVPYMRQWAGIYYQSFMLRGLLPSWYYGGVGLAALRQIERERRCRFPHLEQALPRLAPRPVFMIHGEADNYIRQEMAEALFGCARSPKEFWLVPGANHNGALHLCGDEYRKRVLTFFEQHLADKVIEAPAAQPQPPAHNQRHVLFK
jgi:predicted alpha/beta hydrolase